MLLPALPALLPFHLHLSLASALLRNNSTARELLACALSLDSRLPPRQAVTMGRATSVELPKTSMLYQFLISHTSLLLM
ncbi:hypothetical protein F5X97DRAFT_316042 [Nemania serpens]|nr:hypothetical protein F5X97DRAFT_316042 [Nemania serpens]